MFVGHVLHLLCSLFFVKLPLLKHMVIRLRGNTNTVTASWFDDLQRGLVIPD